MKKLNKKGFTLVELLAVIVILGILIAVSIPAINTILSNARKDTMKNEAASIAEAVKTYRAANNKTGAATYSLVVDVVNDTTQYKTFQYGYNAYESNILDSAVGKSAFGENYTAVVVTVSDAEAYTVCVQDAGGNGIDAIAPSSLQRSLVKTTDVTCAPASFPQP